MYLYFSIVKEKSLYLISSFAPVVMIALSMGNTSFAHAESGFDEDFDARDKSWAELALQLPPAPITENLLPFYVSPAAVQNFWIDPKSVSVGADGVVRYTLVAASASGAKSISYEGIRCELWQKKLYAFWRAEGTWSRSQRDQWERISANVPNRQHAALATDYFCQGGMVAGKASEIVERIRLQRPFAQQ
jgi:hypothetical protein